MAKETYTVVQLSLPLQEQFAVFCFFHCPYVARSVDPQEAHDAMEGHYREEHSHQIARILHGQGDGCKQ